jgi:hypothetical protein
MSVSLLLYLAFSLLPYAQLHLAKTLNVARGSKRQHIRWYSTSDTASIYLQGNQALTIQQTRS